MAESVGTLVADLRLGGISKFAAGLKRAAAGFDKLGVEAKIAGGLIVGFVGVKAVKAIGAGISSLIEFQKAMAEVGTLTNATAKETAALADNVRELSVQFGAPAVETASALYQTISAGFSDAADSSQVLTTALKLGIGGVTDTTTAVDGLTTILNSYEIDAGGATDVSDKLFIAMRAGKTTIGELSSSMGTVTSIAAALGVGLDEVLAATSALTTGGKKTKIAVTELRQVFVNILKPSAQAAMLAKELGIEFNAAALRSKGLAGFLEEVRAKTGGSTEAMSLLFGSVEAVNAVLGLTGPQAEAMASIIDQMGDSAGASEAAFKTMADTTDFKIKQLGESWDKFRTTLADAVVPTITTVVEALSDIVEGAGDAVASLDGLGNRLDAVAKKQQAATDAAKSQEERIASAQKTLLEFGITLGEIEDIFITGTSAVSAFAGISGLEGLEKQVALLISDEEALIKANEELFDSLSGAGQKATDVANAVGNVLGGATDKATRKLRKLKEELTGIQAVIAKGGFATDFGFITARQRAEQFGGGPGGVVSAPATGPTGVDAAVAGGGFAQPVGFQEAQQQIAIFGGGIGTVAEELQNTSEVVVGLERAMALLGAEASGVSAALATGDLLGAAIALVASTGALDPVLDAVSEMFAEVVAPFEGLFEGIGSLIEAVTPITGIVVKILKPALDALGKVFTFIGKAILSVVIFILKAADVATLGLTGLDDTIEKLEKTRRELGKKGELRQLEAEEEKREEDRIRRAKNVAERAKLGEKFGDAGKALDGLTETTRALNASFSQLPSGFKIASAAFATGTAFTRREAAGGVAGRAEAFTTVDPAALAARIGAGAAGLAGRVVNINIAQQTNQVKDVPDFVKQLTVEQQRQELMLAGFAAPRSARNI